MLRKVEMEIRSDEKLVLCGDLNGHMRADVLVFEEVYGGQCILVQPQLLG
jgi:hypothetical protein